MCACGAGWTSSRSYALNSANQDAGGFHITGFADSDLLFVSIGLVQVPAGTTMRLATTTGLTASTGYVLADPFTRISFTATKANANAALSALKLNTGSVPGPLQVSVSATLIDAGYLYLPTNGHFYRCVHPFARICTHLHAGWRRRENIDCQSYVRRMAFVQTIMSNACMWRHHSQRPHCTQRLLCTCTAGLHHGRRASQATTHLTRSKALRRARHTKGSKVTW